MESRYLRTNTVAEPLIGGWYASPHLMSPPSAALLTTGHHVPLLESFLEAPDVHEDSARTRALAGGAFMDLGRRHVPAIRDLLSWTRDARRPLFELADAIRALDGVLSGSGTGGSLEPLYANLPEALRGRVELVYDTRHQPSARFLEPLFYDSPFYDTRMHALALSTQETDRRPFVLSTPRVDRGIQVARPFDSDPVNRLCRSRRHPVDVDALAEDLGIAAASRAAFGSLFTTEVPAQAAPRFPGPGLRVRYFGHACVLVETAEVSILLDPSISHGESHDPPRYGYADLPEHIDYVFLTHAHQDHTLLETLMALRDRIGTIVFPRNNAGSVVDPSLRWVLHKAGFRRLLAVEDFDEVPLEGGRVIAMPFFGEHGDLDIRSKAAYCVELGGRRLFFAADSKNLERRLYELLAARMGPIDMLFIGMECEGAPVSWVYGPLLARPLKRRDDQSRRLDGSHCAMAMQIVKDLGCRAVVVYAMGREPWMGHIMSLEYEPTSRPIVESNKLLDECKRLGVPTERPFGQAEWHV